MRAATCVTAILSIAAGSGFAASGAFAAAAWKPDKVVEIVINTAPGNSPDKTARAIQKIIQDRKLADAPVTVSNRVGGGGAVAYTYLNQRPADGHFIAIASKAILTNHIMGRGPNPADFTAIAHLFDEYVAITVKADSPIKSGRDLVERLKQDAGAVSFGIATSLGNINQQSVATVLKEAGIDIKKTRNVVFQSGVLARTAMLGGHVDVVPMALGTAAGPLQNGQLRIIAVAAPKRVPGLFANEPTWREQGYDVVMSNWRSVIAPKGLPAPQVAYWEQTLVRVTETDEWKKDLEANFWDSDFLGSAATRKLMESDHAKIKAFLVELDLASSK